MAPAADERRALARPAIFVGSLLVLLPLFDFASNIWPLQFGLLQWRFGAGGLLSGFLLTPLLGFVILIFGAMTLRNRAVLRTFSAMCLLSALALCVVIATFSLDVVQLRTQVPVEEIGSYDFAAARATAKTLCVAFAIGWLARVGFAAASRVAQPSAAVRSERHPPARTFSATPLRRST